MSNLIERHKREKEAIRLVKRNRCLEFTNIMKKIVDNQEEKTGYFLMDEYKDLPYSRNTVKYYYVKCDEFEQFVRDTNNNPNNKTFINYVRTPREHPFHDTVAHILTNVDIKNEKVTYTLKWHS